MTLGKVLRDLSRRRRKGAYKVASALGVYHTTVYAWWKDEYRPSAAHLQAYADLMEVSMDEILKQAENDGQRQAIAERVYAVLARVAGGEDPVSAFVAETAAPNVVTKERRAALQQAAQQFKGTLSDLAGEDWDTAPAEVREQVLADLRAELLGP